MIYVQMIAKKHGKVKAGGPAFPGKEKSRGPGPPNRRAPSAGNRSPVSPVPRRTGRRAAPQAGTGGSINRFLCFDREFFGGPAAGMGLLIAPPSPPVLRRPGRRSSAPGGSRRGSAERFLCSDRNNSGGGAAGAGIGPPFPPPPVLRRSCRQEQRPRRIQGSSKGPLSSDRFRRRSRRRWGGSRPRARSEPVTQPVRAATRHSAGDFGFGKRCFPQECLICFREESRVSGSKDPPKAAEAIARRRLRYPVENMPSPGLPGQAPGTPPAAAPRTPSVPAHSGWRPHTH